MLKIDQTSLPLGYVYFLTCFFEIFTVSNGGNEEQRVKASF